MGVEKQKRKVSISEGNPETWTVEPLRMKVFHSQISQVHSYTYTLIQNIKYIEKIYEMSYSALSDNGMLQIFTFFII